MPDASSDDSARSAQSLLAPALSHASEAGTLPLFWTVMPLVFLMLCGRTATQFARIMGVSQRSFTKGKGAIKQTLRNILV